MGLGVAVAVTSGFLTIPEALFGLFGIADATTVSIGVGLLRYLAVSGLFVTVALTYTGGLQGTGDTRSPLYISLVSQLALPLGLCAFLQQLRGLEPGDIWTAIVLGHVTRAVLSVLRFRQGRWRSIHVDIGSRR
jgi:Na+-driven multidrug efflux pump